MHKKSKATKGRAIIRRRLQSGGQAGGPKINIRCGLIFQTTRDVERQEGRQAVVT